MSQMERLYWFDDRIRARQYPHWQHLVERFSISRRTALGDVAYLRDRLDAPIAFHSGRNGYHYTEPTYSLPFLALDRKEAATLRQALLAAHSYLPETDARLARELALKLSPYLRGVPVHNVERIDGREIFSGRIQLAEDTSPSESLLQEVRNALDLRQRLHIVYSGAHRGEITERTIRPYSLLNWRGELYLIAYCELRQAMRDFFLPRIRQWTLRSPAHAYDVPNDFDVADYLRNAFLLERGKQAVSVRLHFSSKQAVWIRERRYHPSQQNEEQADGSLIISLNIPLTDDLTRWLIGYGAEVLVLEPAELRQTIREEVVRMRDLYGAA